MLHKLQVSILIVIAMFCLGGCLSSGGSDGGSSISSGAESSSTSSILSTVPGLGVVPNQTPSPAVSTAPITTFHNPEPLTIALFGGGLLGYALLKRRKKKK